jgi:hypothetical protein
MGSIVPTRQQCRTICELESVWHVVASREEMRAMLSHLNSYTYIAFVQTCVYDPHTFFLPPRWRTTLTHLDDSAKR